MDLKKDRLEILDMQGSIGKYSKAIRLDDNVIVLSEDGRGVMSAEMAFELACAIEELVQERDRYKSMVREDN